MLTRILLLIFCILLSRYKLNSNTIAFPLRLKEANLIGLYAEINFRQGVILCSSIYYVVAPNRLFYCF